MRLFHDVTSRSYFHQQECRPGSQHSGRPHCEEDMIERIVCSYSSLIRLLQFVKYIVIVFSILNFNLYGHIFPSISQKNSPDLGLFSYAVLYALYLDAVLGTLPAVGAVHNHREVQDGLVVLTYGHQRAARSDPGQTDNRTYILCLDTYLRWLIILNVLYFVEGTWALIVETFGNL